MTRRTYDSFRMPDQIAIFRGPILRVSRTRAATRIARSARR